MMNWQILDTGASPAAENMEIDSRLLNHLTHPILRFYEWKGDSATYGHFIRPFDHLKEEGVQKMGLALAKRPTGGGIIFHLWDFTFSILIPAGHKAYSRNTLDNYALINGMVVSIMRKMCGRGSLPALLPKKCCQASFCMEAPTIYDVMLGGQKIGGAAQRCTKFGLLHQGSIALLPPCEEYLQEVLIDGEAVKRMQQMSAALGPLIGLGIEETKGKLKQYLRDLCILI